MAQHRTPTHLSEGSQTWLQGLRDDDDRTWSTTEWRLLLLAAEAWDRAATARRTLIREGLTLTAPILSKKGDVVGERVTAHPAAGIARDNAALFSKLATQLGLDAPSWEEDDAEKPEEEPDKPGGILLRLAEQRTG